MSNNTSIVMFVAIGGLALLMFFIGSLIIDSQVAVLQEQYPELSAEVCRAAVSGQLSKSKVLAHPDWQWEVILKKNVRNGMTKEEVMESWGSQIIPTYNSVENTGYTTAPYSTSSPQARYSVGQASLVSLTTISFETTKDTLGAQSLIRDESYK